MKLVTAVQSYISKLADRYMQPFALIDEKMSIYFISKNMEDYINASKGLLLADNKLLIRDSDENARLHKLVSQSNITASAKSDCVGDIISISADRKYDLCLRVMPIVDEYGNTSIAPDSVLSVVFLYSSKIKFSLTAHQLAKQYDLTERECRLATLLCEGLSLEKIAKLNNVKTSTLRVQLKSIYLKTNTHRQGELIVTLLKSFAAHRI